MFLSIKKSGGLGYARKEAYEYDEKQYEADLQHGDTIKILDSGEVEQGNFGEQTVFKIKTRNGDKRMPLNQNTINVLVQEFGKDTNQWINKEVKVILHKGIFGGKKGIAAYLVTEDWTINEYGELEKSLGDYSVNPSPDRIPDGKSDEITVDQIPF